MNRVEASVQTDGNLASSTDLQSHGASSSSPKKRESVHQYVLHKNYLIARQQHLADAVRKIN